MHLKILLQYTFLVNKVIYYISSAYQAWKFGGNDCFVTVSFPLLIKDGNNNLFPQIQLHNTNTFFEDLTGKHFYNLTYKLHFLHTDLLTLHKRVCFSTSIPPLSIYLECSPTQCAKKNKQRNVFQLNMFYNYQLSNYTKK